MSQFDLVHERRFLPLFVTQFLGAFNDNVFRFALVIFITFSVAGGSDADSRNLVVISGGIFILPFFLFSAVAGQVADKYEKSSLIKHIKLLEIFVMALASIGFWLQSTTFLLIVLFLMGTQSTFFGPLKYGILPQHLHKHELTGGNGLIQMGTYIAILLGAIVGGMLSAIDGYGPAPIVSGIVVVAILGRWCAGHIPTAPASDPTIDLSWNLPRATWSLLRYAGTQGDILVIILTISWFWFLGATFLSMVPSYGKELLGGDEQVVTLLNAAFTIGIGIGSVLCEKLSRGQIELGLVPIGCLGISLFAADFYFVGEPQHTSELLTVGAAFTHPASQRAFVALVCIGAFGAIFIVPLYAALQARMAQARAARVIAALNITNAIFMVLSALFTLLLYRWGLAISDIFGLVAMLNIVAMVIAARALPEFTQRAYAYILRRNKTP